LDLEIADGEFTILVGPSGSGKSTALRMVAGLEDATGGEITIGSRIVNDIAPKDRDIAMVFQSYALYPHMSVRENMAFGLQMRGAPKDQTRERVAEAAQILELGDLLDRKPRQLSGGQRQRVALGRAIVRDPAAFLLDEPLSNLDAKLRGQTRIEIQGLHRRLGATFVYVTHDQVEAMTMGDRIAVMRDGVLQQVATPWELFSRPANRFVAGFIGSPTMNFLDVELDGRTARGAGFAIDLPSAPPLRRGVLGVRPEALVAAADGPFALEVEVVEVLGSDQYVYGRTAGERLVVRLAADRRVVPGDRLALRPEGDLHLFDAETEQALDLTPGAPAPMPA
jgi:ABC-type sugar transport system ATPase subunit